MKPRNYVMALIAKNDPTRYHTRSVEAEHVKLQRNRARRRAKERKEICEGSSMVEHAAVARTMRVRFSPCTPGVLPPPRTLTDSDRDIIIAEANAWNREFSKRVANIEIYRS
jgi:hypothetical protein